MYICKCDLSISLQASAPHYYLTFRCHLCRKLDFSHLCAYNGRWWWDVHVLLLDLCNFLKMNFRHKHIWVPHNFAGPIVATKYLSRNCSATLWSKSIALCLTKVAHAARLRFWNSMIFSYVGDEQPSFPRYLYESTSYKTFTNTSSVSTKFGVELSSDRFDRRSLYLLYV